MLSDRALAVPFLPVAVLAPAGFPTWQGWTVSPLIPSAVAMLGEPLPALGILAILNGPTWLARMLSATGGRLR